MPRAHEERRPNIYIAAVKTSRTTALLKRLYYGQVISVPGICRPLRSSGPADGDLDGTAGPSQFFYQYWEVWTGHAVFTVAQEPDIFPDRVQTTTLHVQSECLSQVYLRTPAARLCCMRVFWFKIIYI